MTVQKILKALGTCWNRKFEETQRNSEHQISEQELNGYASAPKPDLLWFWFLRLKVFLIASGLGYLKKSGQSNRTSASFNSILFLVLNWAEYGLSFGLLMIFSSFISFSRRYWANSELCGIMPTKLHGACLSASISRKDVLGLQN